MKSISIVVPVLNEERNITNLVRRLSSSLESLDFRIEILFVDDGSTDATLERLREEFSKDTRIKVISFSRNFGHQIAVSAALEHATGDAVVVIDGDLQDPPEFIPSLVAKWQEGYDVVYAVRKKRNEGMVKKTVAALFYRLLQKIAEVKIPLDTGDFALMDRKVVDTLKRMPERSRYIRGLRAWGGFKSIGVEYERDARTAGQSKYTLKKMIDLAATGIIGFSIVPLRIATYLGLLIAIMSMLAGVVVLIQKILGVESLVKGWASIMLSLFFLSGIQLFILGVIGEYIGRIYREVQSRPLYIVKEKIGLK